MTKKSITLKECVFKPSTELRERLKKNAINKTSYVEEVCRSYNESYAERLDKVEKAIATIKNDISAILDVIDALTVSLNTINLSVEDQRETLGEIVNHIC